MPLTSAIHDSLPYIDSEPTAAERAAALSLIQSELPPSTDPHPLQPELLPSTFSPLILSEFSRIEAKQPLKAITTTHYESLDPPATTPHSDSKSPEVLEAWRAALSNAYTSHTHLSGRIANLELLEKYGKNAWLEGNKQLEDMLRGLERELKEKKEEIDRCVIERKDAQEEVSGEIRGLNEGWRKGVGRVLETEVAAEGVRREVLERRREGAK